MPIAEMHDCLYNYALSIIHITICNGIEQYSTTYEMKCYILCLLVEVQIPHLAYLCIHQNPQVRTELK